METHANIDIANMIPTDTMNSSTVDKP